MKMKIRRCKSCNIYTLKKRCPSCEGEVNVIYPPKYSIEDKYGKYRRKLKEESLKSI